MTHFLQAYFWFMTAYLTLAVLAFPFKWERLASAGVPAGLWLETVVGNLLLVLGLVGVYGHLHAVPLISAVFWQGFVVVLGLFSALQHFMPKIQLLRREKGLKVVAAAYAVGIALLAPMFGAVTTYGYLRPGLWAFI